jgi:hypothetical protein
VIGTNIVLWCSSLKHCIMCHLRRHKIFRCEIIKIFHVEISFAAPGVCKCFAPLEKSLISYSSCKTTYFYAKKRSLRAIIIWTKIEEDIFFIGARLATLKQQAPHHICISQKVSLKYTCVVCTSWNWFFSTCNCAWTDQVPPNRHQYYGFFEKNKLCTTVTSWIKYAIFHIFEPIPRPQGLHLGV